MKRYLLFAGFNYYPSGGWDDFVGSFDAIETATDAGRGKGPSGRVQYDWFQVIDRETWERAAEG